MKKYLNKSLFYQGDSKIILPLGLLYLAAILVNNIIMDDFFQNKLKNTLYNISYYDRSFINNFTAILMLISYLIIAYLISVGVFKRKKWTTLLSGPFSRMDIRKREFYIVAFSALIYILIFIFLLIQKTYIYFEVVKYMDSFETKALIDVLKLISISIFVIGGLAFLDSLFSNLYYMAASIVFIFIYMLGVLIYYDSEISNYINNPLNMTRGIYNILDYLQGIYFINENYISLNISISLFFISLGIIFLYIGKYLTNKMFVENMNEGIIFNFPKKILEFMMVTFFGIILSPYITDSINFKYFDYTLIHYKKTGFSLLIMIIITLICYSVFRYVKEKISKKKDKYYQI